MTSHALDIKLAFYGFATPHNANNKAAVVLASLAAVLKASSTCGGHQPMGS
jgi:hypothetical protein